MRLSLLLTGLLLATPALSWATPRVAAPASHMEGYQRGVKPDFLLKTDEITPEALFGKDLSPTLTSFGQGGSGDCYALSAAKVYANPASKDYKKQIEVIKSIFLNEDGSLRRSKAGVPQARFFRKDRKTGEFNAVLVDYDGRVPMHKGEPVFAHEAHKNGQAWGPLFEEVYTKFRNEEGGSARKGYFRTGNGGYSLHVMAALTGQEAEHHVLTLANAPKLLAKIHEAIKNGDVVTTGSNTVDVIEARMKDAVARGLLPKSAANHNWKSEYVIVPGHEYGVPKVDKHSVSTANPWNNTPIFRRGQNGIGKIDNAMYPVVYGDVDIGRGSVKKAPVVAKAARSRS